MKRFTLHIFIWIFMVAGIMPVQAVTKQEMEQARAIAAIGYLRYANNASGYLDEVTASSLDDLQPKLKPTDAENLKAFKKIAAFPPEYAQWDKEQMVKYWGETFFAGKDVPENVRQARKRVTRKLNSMEVATPTAEAKTDTVKTPEPEQPVEVAPAAIEPEIQPDTLMAEEEPVPAEPRDDSDYSTTIYIVILAVLIAIVIALVVYALNSMKSDKTDEVLPKPEKPVRKRKSKTQEITRPEPTADEENAEVVRLKAAFAATLEEKNREIEELRMKLEAAEKLAADATARLTRAASVQAKPAVPRREPVTIFLARANSAGDFVRADSRMNLGNSVFTLVTADGLTGTYSVIDNPTVHEVALMMPSDYLINACTGNDLQQSAGMKRIVTETPGTAVFDKGRWHITRKARIRYTK